VRQAAVAALGVMFAAYAAGRLQKRRQAEAYAAEEADTGGGGSVIYGR